MILIDLSRDIEHKMQVLPNHPQVIMTAFSTHAEVRVADGYSFSAATMAMVMGDHSGTHVDAPKHFDARERVETSVEPSAVGHRVDVPSDEQRLVGFAAQRPPQIPRRVLVQACT